MIKLTFNELETHSMTKSKIAGARDYIFPKGQKKTDFKSCHREIVSKLITETVCTEASSILTRCHAFLALCHTKMNK